MSVIWNSRTTLALATLATIIACESSGAAPGGPERDLDVIPPEILSQTPLHRDPEVSVHQPIEVKFSERVRLSDSAPATLFANTGETDVPVPTTVRLSPDGTVLTIEPTAPLAAPAAYSVRFGDIRDEAGNGLVAAPWEWKAPLWLRVGQPLEDAGDISSSMIVAGPGEQVTVGSTVTVNFPDQRLLVHTLQQSNGKWSLLDNRLKIDSRNAPSLFLDKELGLTALISDQENHVVLDQWLDTKWQKYGPGYSVDLLTAPSVKQTKDGERFVAYTAPRPEPESGTDIVVVHGSDSSRLGGPVNGDDEVVTSVGLISLAMDRQGTPYVAYSADSFSGRLRYWSQGRWALLAPTVTSPGDNTTIRQITVDDAGTPFVLVDISEGAPKHEHRSQIRRFDGDRWINCGERLEMEDRTVPAYFGPALDGHIFAAMTVRNYSAEVPDKFLTLDVTRDGWTAIAPPVDALPRFSTRVSGTVDGRGAPILAWYEGSVVHLRRLNR
ncbi:Ig-like domain-containing protein [Pendulispora rubella]|uniref:Ig-like domain-containing protein n=1 Tax=Pendulispora rubella TaxID=2741070 RepID=A0ABZ2LK29_9BACT